MAEKRDYYEALGVSRDADINAIKKAYRHLARKHHPDVNPDDNDADQRFKDINEAYQVLSDPEKREVYDRYGHQGFEQGFNSSPTGFGDFGDLFDMFFGGGQGQGSRPGSNVERGNDLRYDVELTLEEAAKGVGRSLKYHRMETCDTCGGSGAKAGTHPETCGLCRGAGQVRQQQQSFFGTQIRITTCPRCHGEGKVIDSPCTHCGGHGRVRKTVEKTVDIPGGVDNGMRVRLTGEGDAGPRGGPKGDLYVVTKVRPHEFFERRGSDLWCETTIGFALAALGGAIDVRTLDGSEQLEISAGTQSGEVYSLKGKGMPDPAGRHRGNLNVIVKVETPTRLTDEQKSILHQFAEARGENINDSEGKSFFDRVKDALNGQ